MTDAAPPAPVHVPAVYGRTAADTVAAAFEHGPPSPDRPLEAPADQYDDVVRLVGQRTGGDGAAVVAEGAYQYRQAAAVAGGGKVGGLSLDPATGRVRCDPPGGVTAALRRAQSVWAGGDVVKTEEGRGGLFGAVRSAAGAGAGAVGWLAGKVVGKVRGRALAAVLGRNPAALMFAAGPSVYRALVTGETSWRQATKDLFEAGAAAGGAAAGAAAGAAVGATVGSVVPVFGTFLGGAAGGLAGGFFGGDAGERGGQFLADRVAPDDADALRPLLADELADLAFEYALVPAEVDRLRLAAEEHTDDRALRRLYATAEEAKEDGGPAAAEKAVRGHARETFEPLCDAVVADRATVPPPPA